jgi:hypothetical protein
LWYVTQRVLVVGNRRFETTYLSHILRKPTPNSHSSLHDIFDDVRTQRNGSRILKTR